MSKTFGKSERLHSKKIIDEVFAQGKTLSVQPFLLKYMPMKFESGGAVQIAISVPKRKVPLAVKRNKLKRQIKEVYRLNKSNLLSKFNNTEEGLALFLIYQGGPQADYKTLEDKLKVLLQKLENKIA